jgi:hypothetical protein
MLHGRWPRVSAGGASLANLEADVARGRVPLSRLEAATEELVAEVVGVQVAAGLDLVTDGQVRWADPGAAVLRALGDGDTGADGLLVHAWRSTAALTDGVAAQSITGPYSLGLRVYEGRDAERRTEFTLELAARLAGELTALAAAGCPMVLVEEPAAVGIGTSGSTSTDDAERGLFASAQAGLLADRPALHAMLVVTGGSAWPAGAPYQSYLFDLIDGPDNWYLVRAAPGDRGIVCGAHRAESVADQLPELVWAARYAASANARGLERVGVANGASIADAAPDAIRRAAEALARASRLAPLPLDEAIAQGLDPRTIRQPFDPPTGRRRRRPTNPTNPTKTRRPA